MAALKAISSTKDYSETNIETVFVRYLLTLPQKTGKMIYVDDLTTYVPTSRKFTTSNAIYIRSLEIVISYRLLIVPSTFGSSHKNVSKI